MPPHAIKQQEIKKAFEALLDQLRELGYGPNVLDENFAESIRDTIRLTDHEEIPQLFEDILNTYKGNGPIPVEEQQQRLLFALDRVMNFIEIHSTEKTIQINKNILALIEKYHLMDNAAKENCLRMENELKRLSNMISKGSELSQFLENAHTTKKLMNGIETEQPNDSNNENIVSLLNKLIIRERELLGVYYDILRLPNEEKKIVPFKELSASLSKLTERISTIKSIIEKFNKAIEPIVKKLPEDTGLQITSGFDLVINALQKAVEENKLISEMFSTDQAPYLSSRFYTSLQNLINAKSYFLMRLDQFKELNEALQSSTEETKNNIKKMINELTDENVDAKLHLQSSLNALSTGKVDLVKQEISKSLDDLRQAKTKTEQKLKEQYKAYEDELKASFQKLKHKIDLQLKSLFQNLMNIIGTIEKKREQKEAIAENNVTSLIEDGKSFMELVQLRNQINEAIPKSLLKEFEEWLKEIGLPKNINDVKASESAAALKSFKDKLSEIAKKLSLDCNDDEEKKEVEKPAPHKGPTVVKISKVEDKASSAAPNLSPLPNTDATQWGNLKDKERETVLQIIKEKFNGQYEDLVRQYFKSLAEDEKKPRSSKVSPR